MNPDTNKFEFLHHKMLDKFFEKERVFAAKSIGPDLVRPNGEPVPKHWSVFRVDEEVVVKDYTFKVAHIGESHLLLEPVGPVIIGEDK